MSGCTTLRSLAYASGVVLAIGLLTPGSGRTGGIGASSLVLPSSDWGACPFECCTYREWTVTAPTRVLVNPSRSARVAFCLVPGDTVAALTGVVITRRAGIAKVLRPSRWEDVIVEPGDSVYVLHNEGEGSWKCWLRGHVFSAEIQEVRDGEEVGAGPEAACLMVRQPDIVWWAKVRHGAGDVGWARVEDNFTHMDACE